MKKILIVFSLLAPALAGCENFLDTESLTEKDTSNTPSTELEINQLLTGVYMSAMFMENQELAKNSFMVAEIFSDDRFAGGGSDDALWADMEKFIANDPNFLEPVWQNAYRAIFRANVVIESLDLVQDWGSPEARDYVEGQAYFLRGYSFFNLAKLFGTVPLTVNSEPANLPKADVNELFAYIASDFKTAIEKMPSTRGIPVDNRGRATKWAAEAMMARAFLFYTGYYDKTEIALPGEEGGMVTKQNVIDWLDDCIDNSGHDLIGDFRNLWPYSNPYTRTDYPYSSKNGLNWIGEEGANVETVFGFTFSPEWAGWDTGQSTEYANRLNLYFSIRYPSSKGNVFPFGEGWGFGTVNPQLWAGWPDNDIRKKGSIIDVRDPDEMLAYTFGSESIVHETGYIGKKYICIQAYAEGDAEGAPTSYYDIEAYGADLVLNDYQIVNTQDLVMIRFADVLLMAAELKEDAAPLNLVRARAGLGDVAYSLQNLQNERRWELAFEGIRYWDLLRWGIAGETLATQDGIAVLDEKIPTTMDLPNQVARVAETGGFMPIPENQIALSGGVLEQNPGWGL